MCSLCPLSMRVVVSEDGEGLDCRQEGECGHRAGAQTRPQRPQAGTQAGFNTFRDGEPAGDSIVRVEANNAASSTMTGQQKARAVYRRFSAIGAAPSSMKADWFGGYGVGDEPDKTSAMPSGWMLVVMMPSKAAVGRRQFASAGTQISRAGPVEVERVAGLPEVEPPRVESFARRVVRGPWWRFSTRLCCTWRAVERRRPSCFCSTFLAAAMAVKQRCAVTLNSDSKCVVTRSLLTPRTGRAMLARLLASETDTDI